MKKIALLLNNYFPTGNAIANVMKPLIDEIAKNNWELDLYCFNKNGKIPNYEKIFNNYTIYRVDNNTNSIKKIIMKMNMKLFNFDSNRIVGIKKYRRMIENNMKEKQYDLIITTSYPFCMHEIGKFLKSKYKVKWIAFQFDPYTLNNAHKGFRKIKYKHEKNILEYADCIFMPEENIEENLKFGYEKLKNKYIIFKYPILNKTNSETERNTIYNIVFTGVFYKDIREPFIPISILNEFDDKYISKLYFISDKKMKNRIDKMKYNKEKIMLYYNKSQNICNEAQKKADILLNIGNKITNQTPSKIFEYISQGKPILNFYNTDEDTSYLILKKYPLGVNIKISNYDISDIKEQLEVYKNKRLKFDEIENIYPDEVNSARNIANYIKEILNK